MQHKVVREMDEDDHGGQTLLKVTPGHSKYESSRFILLKLLSKGYSMLQLLDKNLI